MKKFIAIGAMALVMTTCSSPATGALTQASTVALYTAVQFKTLESQAPEVGSLDWMVEQKEKQNALAAEAIRLEKVAENTEKLNKVIGLVKKQVGKTWYVFSGSTPQGWDCSGLVMWAYGNLGYSLEHRASKQKDAGEKVSEPKLGDIVAFVYNGNKSAYHVGIWVGPDEMIHAGGGKGDRTSIVSISRYAGEHSKVTFTRILETN